MTRMLFHQKLLWFLSSFSPCWTCQSIWSSCMWTTLVVSTCCGELGLCQYDEDDDDDAGLNVLRCQDDILGTVCWYCLTTTFVHPTPPSPVPVKLGQRWMTHQSMENVVTYHSSEHGKCGALIIHQSMENVVTYHSPEHGKCGHLSLTRAWKMWSLITQGCLVVVFQHEVCYLAVSDCSDVFLCVCVWNATVQLARLGWTCSSLVAMTAVKVCCETLVCTWLGWVGCTVH